MSSFKMYMVPMPIGNLSHREMNSELFLKVIKVTTVWVAENARTTRRFISSLQLGIEIDKLKIFELNRQYSTPELYAFLRENIVKSDIAITSEAGLPGMADPGGVAAMWAHDNDIELVSITGPGSVYLALSGSGLNGQQFTFHGYAPIKDPELKGFIQSICNQTISTGYTQIFIETPYRSDRILQALLTHCPAQIHLCIAEELQSDQAQLRTCKISDWRTQNHQIGKKPCVFLLGMPTK